jgi:hypothetical protein
MSVVDRADRAERAPAGREVAPEAGQEVAREAEAVEPPAAGPAAPGMDPVEGPAADPVAPAVLAVRVVVPEAARAVEMLCTCPALDLRLPQVSTTHQR